MGVAVGVGAVAVLTGFKGEGDGGGCEGLKLESIVANGLFWLSASVAMFVAIIWLDVSLFLMVDTKKEKKKGGKKEKKKS